jgi:hypothetical protein
VWRDYTFTFTTTVSGDGSTSVELFLVNDLSESTVVVGSGDRPCAELVAGWTCFDDIGIFAVDDVG